MVTEPRPQAGAIESFIAEFHRLEQDADLFSLHDADAFPWWDLVRYDVQFSLCVERGMYGPREEVAPPTMARVRSFARQTAVLARDLRRLHRIAPGQVRQMLITTRESQQVENAIAELRRAGQAALLVNRDGATAPPHHVIAKQSVDFFIRLSMRAKRMPPEFAAAARKLADATSARFESRVDLFAVIERAYRRHLASKQVWALVLDRAEPLERIAFVNDGTLKTLVFLARQRGITTQEIQHGYMGRSHVGYSYPPLEHVPATLPDSVIITRDTGDIVYPIAKIPALKIALEITNTPRDIDVLVAASPANMQRTIDVVAALVGRGLHVAIKLHPAQTSESSGLAQRFSSDKLQIYGGDEKFFALAQRAKVFVPVNPMSTTTFEAVENGAKLIVVDYDGVKITNQADDIVVARVDALHKLGEAVATALQLDTT